MIRYFNPMKNIFLFLLLIMFSCNQKKQSTEPILNSSEIIPTEEMTKIMEDVMLVEGVMGMGVSEQKFKDYPYYSSHYYNFILKKHNITSNQLRESINYYASDSEKMLKIMQDVLNNLSEKQSKVAGK